MSTAINKRPMSYYVNSLVAICLMLFFGFLPAIEPLTPFGMRILGIFLGAIYGWCTVEMIWPSFLALIMLGFTEYTTVTAAFQTAASNETVLISLFFLCIAYLIQTSGLGTVIANKILSMKISRGRPWVMSTMLLLAAYIATILLKSTPAVLLCWTFLYSIGEAANMPKQHKYMGLMVVGIVYTSIFSQCLIPIFMGVLVNFGLASAAYGETLQYSYVVFMAWAFIVGIAATLLYILMCKFIIRPDVSALKNIDYTKFADKQHLNSKQKVICILFVVLIFALLSSSLFPSSWAVTKFFTKLGTLGIVMGFLALIMFIPSEGKSLGGNFKDLAQGIAWDLIIMVATALTLAGALVSDGTGIKVLVADLVTPFLGNYSPYVFLAVLMLLVLFLTNLINNVVVSTILIPIVIPMADTIGFSPVALTSLFTITASIGILLPSGSPSGALIHSNREYLPAKRAIWYSFLTNLSYIIVLLVVAIPLAMIML